MTCESAEMIIPSIPRPSLVAIAGRLFEELAVPVDDGNALVLLGVSGHRLAADIQACGSVAGRDAAAHAHQYQRLLARRLEPVVRAGGQHDPLVLADVH